MPENVSVKVASQREDMVRLCILGEFRLLIAGQDLSLSVSRSSKLKNILCYLILHRERPVSRDELIETFYENENQRDPVSALKMQIMRIRQLLAPCLNAGLQPILGQRGAYQWNPKISCWVDAQSFETLCRQASQAGLTAQQRCPLYQEAIALYTGDSVLGKDDTLWSGTVASRYHSLYVEAAETYAELLIEEGETAQAETVCLHAIEREPAGETLYMLLIRTLLLQRRYGEARTHYKRISNTLHHSLGVRPSPELKRLYDGIADGKPGQERDLDIVMDGMRETASVRTAFFCGFDQFRSIYQLEARRAPRTGACLHVVMLSVEEGCDDDVMEQVQQTVVCNLRNSDVVARYNSNQFLIMLPEANLEDSRQVMERLARAYSQRYPEETIGLSWQIRGLELL